MVEECLLGEWSVRQRGLEKAIRKRFETVDVTRKKDDEWIFDGSSQNWTMLSRATVWVI